jgi:hypothetical protein
MPGVVSSPTPDDLDAKMPRRNGRRSALDLIATMHENHEKRIEQARVLPGASVAFTGAHGVAQDEVQEILRTTGASAATPDAADLVVAGPGATLPHADATVVDGEQLRSLYADYERVYQPSSLRSALKRARSVLADHKHRAASTSNTAAPRMWGSRERDRADTAHAAPTVPGREYRPAGTQAARAIDTAADRLASSLGNRNGAVRPDLGPASDPLAQTRARLADAARDAQRPRREAA